MQFLRVLFVTTIFAATAIASGDEIVLVKDGKAAVPIMISSEASEVTLAAASDLAGWIERISGARPEILKGEQKTVPAHAIWIGAHPQLAQTMPGLNLSFTKPEEILIASANGQVVLIGRDRQVGDLVQEAGTTDAVYTFAQKNLGIRWLWPGKLGEDFPRNATIKVPAGEYRFAPPFVQRDVFRNLGNPRSNSLLPQWCLRSRIYYFPAKFPIDHAFPLWWKKYGKDHPEYFALQPDGTRGTYPENASRKKVCEGEPGVWKQWLEEVGEKIQQNPAMVFFNASQNDGANSGLCVDPRSTAWDNPKAKTWRYDWADSSKDGPSLTNRSVTFWNTLAGMLKQKYPDREAYVAGMAYGPSKNPPIDLKAADNVAIAYVGHTPFTFAQKRDEEKADITAWTQACQNVFYRPNVLLYSGGWHGLPAVSFQTVAESFRFLADAGVKGVLLDTLPDHWSTQGPLYYLLAQLAWDPQLDAKALMADYYARGFGPAADDIRAYFELMEKAHARVFERPDWKSSSSLVKPLGAYILAECWTPEIRKQARVLLDEAARKAGRDGKFAERVAFVRKGWDFSDQLLDTMALMNRIRDSKGQDYVAVEEAVKKVAEREAFFAAEDAEAKAKGTNPPISSHRFNVTFARSRDQLDYVGPVSQVFLAAAEEARASGYVIPQAAQTDDSPSSGEATGGTEFRWTGATKNGLWGTASNWQTFVNNRWRTPATPPGAGSTVVLDDTASPDRRTINLSSNTETGVIVIAATEAPYVLGVPDDRDTEGLDAESGAIAMLTLTDNVPLRQKSATSAPLVIRCNLSLSGQNPGARLDSASGAPIEIAGGFSSGRPTEVRPTAEAKGVLKISGKEGQK